MGIPRSRIFGVGAQAVLAASLALGLLTGTLRAAAEDPPPQFSDKAAEAFTKLPALVAAKDWDGALALLGGALAAAGPESYDRAYLLDTVAKLEFQKDDIAKAIPAWEGALQLADRHPNYFKPQERIDLMLYLSQTYSQVAQNTKDPALARASFAKAAEYIRRWLAATSKPTFEAEDFYARVLYSEATANDKKIDPDLLRQAEEAAQKALHLQVRPKEGPILLLELICRDRQDLDGSARYLEFLVQMMPTKETYWQQLWAVYANLASSVDKDEQKAREYYAKAINTVERAQAFGKMKSRKDQFNLATMYYSAGQYERATELLSAGLRDHSIDPLYPNWELLSYSYQQINQPAKAIAALQEAQRIPALAGNGNLDVEIANIYTQMEKPSEAYHYYKSAVAKGNLDKPFTAYQYLAYQAYAEEEYQDALDAVTKALTFPQGQTSKGLANLRKLIQQSLDLQKARNGPAADPATAAPK